MKHLPNRTLTADLEDLAAHYKCPHNCIERAALDADALERIMKVQHEMKYIEKYYKYYEGLKILKPKYL